MIKIIQIDDDLVNNIAVERLCRKAGFNAEFINFTDPTEALDYFKNNDVVADFIILDINMPKLSGWEMLEHFTDLNIQIPIYMVTSSLDAREKEKALSHSLIKEFYVKPLNVEVFTKMVNNLK